MKLLIFAFALFALNSLAQDAPVPAVGGTRVDTSVGGGNAMDMLNLRSAPFEEGAGNTNSNIKIYGTCTSVSGAIYQKGDPEYDSCIETQARKAEKSMKPTVSGSANKNGQSESVGAGFKIGN